MVPHDRHAVIFSSFSQLGSGEAMELINDHDPKPLHFQFMVDLPGKFSWDYLEQGPGTWRVAITRLASGHSNGGCCGGCGGA
ncbi:MAG: DUF2249 domain-containing protein [Polaromonas sp.]